MFEINTPMLIAMMISLVLVIVLGYKVKQTRQLEDLMIRSAGMEVCPECHCQLPRNSSFCARCGCVIRRE